MDTGESEGTLPPFANERNRQLDRENREMEKRLESVKRELSEQRERLSLMTQHLRNVELELGSHQGVVEGKQSQAQAELRLARLAEREAAKVKADSERVRKEQADVAERTKVAVQQGEARRAAMAEFQKRLDMTQQQMQKFADEERARVEEREALERFRRADEAKVKEITLAVEKLVREKHRHQALLDAQTTEAHAAQIELGKMEQAYRDLSVQHDQAVKECEETLRAIEKRTREIEERTQDVAQSDAQIREKQEMVRERQRFLDGEQSSLNEARAKLEATDRSVAKKRETYGQSQKEVDQYRDEIETVRMMLVKAKATADERRAEIKALDRRMEEGKEKVARYRQRLEETRKRAQTEEDHTGTLEEKSKRMEEFLRKEEARAAQFEKDLVTLKQESFAAVEQLHQRQTSERNLLAEISGSRSASKNLRGQIRKLDSESMKQQEVLYGQEFQLQELEHKIARLMGHRTSDEKAQLATKIVQLTAELDTESQKVHLLASQHKRVLESLKESKKEADVSRKQKEVLQSTIETLQVETDKETKLISESTHRKEEVVVQESLLRMDAKKLRDVLFRHADEVYSLEAMKKDQELAAEEALASWGIRAEELRVQIKTLEEQRHVCRLEIKAREVKLDKLRRKYELLVSKMAGGAGLDAGEDVSQDLVLVKAAQEREEMRVKKAGLEQKAEKVQKELAGIQKALDSLDAHTSKLRAASRPSLTLSRAESESKGSLDQEMQQEEDLRLALQTQFAALQSELVELRKLTEEATQENMRRGGVVASLIDGKSRLDAEIADQSAKLDRAKKSLQRALASKEPDARTPAERPLGTIAEKELTMCELRDAEHETLFNIGRFASVAHPDLCNEVKSIAATLALEIPDSESPSRVTTPGTPGSRLGTSSRVATATGTPPVGTAAGSRTGTAGAPPGRPPAISSPLLESSPRAARAAPTSGKMRVTPRAPTSGAVTHSGSKPSSPALKSGSNSRPGSRPGSTGAKNASVLDMVVGGTAVT